MIHYVNELSTTDELRESMRDSGDHFPFSASEVDGNEFVNNCAKWHWHHFVEFVLVLEGVLECCTPKQVLKIYPGEGYYINTDVLHMNRMAADSPQVKYRVLQFETSVMGGSEAISEKYGFSIDPQKKVYDMSVSEKQTVEIIKVLYRGADILILDEPTAVLTPQETEKLFAVLRAMRDDGKAIIIITHKLQEVLELSDRVSVLRKGEYIGTVPTSEATAQSLTDMMVGQATVLNIERPEPVNPQRRLSVTGLTVVDGNGVRKLSNVSFDVYGGEILGIAGISGCGQKELLEAIAGLQSVQTGSIIYHSENGSEELVGKSAMAIREKGIRLSFVPEDRLGMGLVANMDMAGNMMLRSFKRGRFGLSDRKSPEVLAEQVKDDLEVVTPSIQTPVRRMSGGNVQKVLVGREIAAEPKILMTAYAVRGLDINTSYTIYHLLNQQKEKGVAVIYVGEDLDVLLELCDRILVLCGGQVSGILNGRSATREQVGLMMTKVGGAS